MDEYYMSLALNLALKGKGKVNPNPLVGAVIVKNGKVIGKGYHERYGKEHAEVNAFNNLSESAENATMYVTLEPCAHYGKTPPCVNKIIENSIKKVVIGAVDDNPLVTGKGIKKLKSAGIEVKVGVLEEECKKLNEVFFKYISTKRPFVLLKSAMSLDGKISTYSGESKWITSKESREEVHKLRNDLMAILVGVNTIIKDNPRLTCRVNDGRNPIRIVVDSFLRIPMDSNVIKDKQARTIIATTKFAKKDKILSLRNSGIEVLVINSKNNKVDLDELMVKLGDLNIDSILLEGGSTLNFSALKQEIVDKIQIYIAPKIIGGEKSKTPVDGQGIDKLKNAFKVRNLNYSKVGSDILLEGYIDKE